MEISSYITGFVDGEGSFNVSFNKRQKLSVGVEVRPSFSISQHKRNKDILYRIQKYFNCGGIRFSRSDQNYRYEVRSIKDLVEIILPHFRKFPLQTTKKNDFESFCQIVQLMRQNKHLSKDGILEIFDLAYKMNNFGARRYDKGIFLKIVSKMKV